MPHGTGADIEFGPLVFELDFTISHIRMCGMCMGGICTYVCARENALELGKDLGYPALVIVISHTYLCSPQCAGPHQLFMWWLGSELRS